MVEVTGRDVGNKDSAIVELLTLVQAVKSGKEPMVEEGEENCKRGRKGKGKEKKRAKSVKSGVRQKE